MKIVSGASSVVLAEKISKLLSFPLVSIKTKRFPDGEFYFKFEEDISNEELLIIQSLYPPQDIHAMELFFILHTAKDLNAKSIKIFAPYLAYSRQDERYLDGECISSGMLSDVFEYLNVDESFTVDIHNQNVLNMYHIPTHNLTASQELAKYFYTKDLKDPIIVSPDDEGLAIERVKNAARSINADYDYFEKSRNRHTGDIITYSKRVDSKGRDAIIIDDIISTGKTAANAVKLLKKQGARRIFVGVSHCLLLGNAYEMIKGYGADEIIGTDSVVNKHSKVSVAPILSSELLNRDN
jgi:ribose-phosphate pyrophosphokinase